MLKGQSNESGHEAAILMRSQSLHSAQKTMATDSLGTTPTLAPSHAAPHPNIDCTPWLACAPFDLETEPANVLISYSSRMLDTPSNEQPKWMWALVNALIKEGYKVFVAPMTPAAGGWENEFFGNMHSETCKAVIAMYTPEYFESKKCMEELADAATAKHKIAVVPLLFHRDAKLPEAFLGHKLRNRKLAKHASRKIGQNLPQPGNCFQDNWDDNVKKLCSVLERACKDE